MKKVKTNKLGKRILSIVLTATLVVGLMPGNMLTVSAEGIEAGKSEEIVVETVSSNDASAATECTCETDDPAFHATNCPAYIAPENPQCFCAEKCTDDTLNVWCDVCGMQGVSACQGEDTAVAYTDVVASITNGETVTNYATFDEALANWTDGTTLTLLADVTLTECIKTYAKGLSLDLNGHKIECSDELCTIWIDGDSGSELTIRDSRDGGHINGVVYAVSGGSKLCLESGTVETVAANGDFTMTGGRIISEDGSGLNVNSDVDVVISGGEIYGSRYGVGISYGNVTISGDTKITGEGQYAITSFSSKVVISGTPTISGGAGEFYLMEKITLNTQPADGETWRVKIDTEEITDGLFAVPGEGVTLDASRFASTMDGYDVKQNAKGELLLCNHQTAYAAVSNEDGSTHKMLCCCRETTVEESVACSGFGATCQTKAVCAACGQSYGETNPDVHTFNDDGKCVCGAERDAATTVDLSSLTAIYVISDSGEYIFTGSGSYGIKVESGNPKIVLNNVNISLTDGDYDGNNPINGIHIATTGGTTEILVLGESSITAKAGAGIFVAEGGTVKITGSSREDILIATGASGCSGIGGYVYYTNGSVNCGNIEISNVTVKAFGSASSMGDKTPAIGGAGNGNCGYITIDNADVYAEGYINPYGYKGSSAIGTGDGWGNREGGTIGEISIINDSKVYVTRGNYCDYIGCCGHENAPAEGVVTATAKSSTIYCYDSTGTTEPVQTLKYGALGGLLKEDGTCEGEHTGIICDNCGYCSCTHEGVEPTYALTEDGSRHTATWSCCGYEVTEEHSWNCEPDEANTNKMTFSCDCTKGGTITVTGPEGAIYDGNNHTATVTVETKENEELIETPVITYDSLTEGVELVDGKPVNAGTYQANVSFEGVLSYQEFEIKKATPVVDTLPTVNAITYHPDTTLADIPLSGGKMNGIAGELTGTWAWKDATICPKAGDNTYVAVFTPEDGTNYKTKEVDITVSVAKATPYIKTAVAADAITYGATLKNSALSGGVVQYSETDETAVAGSWSWKEVTTKPVVADSNVTQYDVVFTPTDAENYNKVETKITLTVNKAQTTPNMPESTMSALYSQKTVGAVELPEGWVWNEADSAKELTVDVAVEATAIYNGADKGNYVTESVTISITRQACDHEESDILYTGEGEKAPTCTVDGIGHTECTKCKEPMQTNVTVEASGHTGGTATCKNKAECSTCHEGYGEPDKNNHAGETEVKDAKKATCAVDGYTGDTYCKDCGAKIATGTKIDKSTAHTWDNGVVTKEATATEKGEKTYTCSVCKTTKKEEIPALGAPKVGEEIASEDGSATYKVTEAGENGNSVTYEAPTDKNQATVVVPATVTINNITYNVTTISDTAFAGNKKLTSVTIGDNVTGFSDKTFKGCSNLKTLIIGNGVTSIPANAFKNFKKLTTVKMGTGVKTIGKSAFYGCKALKTITIGKSVTKIGSKAFYGCSKTKTLTIKSSKLTTKKIGSKAFTKTPKSMTVKVPKKKFKAYKSMLIKKGINKKAKFKKI